MQQIINQTTTLCRKSQPKLRLKINTRI